MDTLRHFSAFLSDMDFSVPVSQVIILVTLNSFCLLLGKHKLGLLVSYSFVFYWGFLLNRTHFVNLLGETSWGLYVYAIAGIGMLITALAGFFARTFDS